MDDRFIYSQCQPIPQTRSNIFSKLTFSWLLPLFKKGLSRTLIPTDLYQVCEEDESSRLGDVLESEWKKGEENKLMKASLIQCLFNLFWKQYAIVTFLCFLTECVFKISQPVFLYYLIQFLNEGGESTDWLGYYSAAGLVLTTMFSVISYHLESFTACRLGMKIRIATCSLIYRKILNQMKTSSGDTTPGQLVNMMSNDVNKLEQVPLFLRYLLVATLQMILTTVILWFFIGPSSMIAVLVFVLMVPMQVGFGRLFGNLRVQSAAKTDERVHFMSEIISGIKVIKMYGWERAFMEMVQKVRKEEIGIIRRAAVLRSINGSSSYYITKIILVFTVVLYVMLGNRVTAEKVFLSASIYNIIRVSAMVFCPLAMASGGEGIISARRIQGFLNKVSNNVALSPCLEPTKQACVKLSGVTVSWSPQSGLLSLQNITFTGHSGQVIAVVGKTGSGKSTLLLSLLGETSVLSGEKEVQGRMSYCSQDAFIFNSSLRQNILMGELYDRETFHKVIRAACLETDMQLLPAGDLTPVGDRGVSLSGGQKARISLARTLYQNADIVLLDDPLSAVDNRVGYDIFHSCIKGYLRDKLVILTTHQEQYLKLVDSIYVLHQGIIVESGNYDELVSRGMNFNELHTEEVTADVPKRHSLVAADGTLDTLVMDDPERTLDDTRVEKTSSGAVSLDVYWSYISAGNSAICLFIFLVVLVISQISYALSDVWVTFWIEIQEKDLRSQLASMTSRTTSSYIFFGLVLAVSLSFTLKSLWFFIMCIKSSVSLHDNMLHKVITSPMAFFDNNPAGTILNRFSKDMGMIDDLLPLTFDDTLTILCISFVTVIVIIGTNYWIAIPSLVLLIVVLLSRWFYLETARDIKRLEGTTRSPVFSHITSTIQGIITIRSSRQMHTFQQEFDRHQDLHTSSWYLFLCTTRWLGIVLDLTLAVYLTISVAVFLALKSMENGSQLGLAVTLIMSMEAFFQWGVRQSAELESQMTSVERVKEYGDLPSEGTNPLLMREPPSNWPDKGGIVYRDVSLFYADEVCPVLKGLNFTIQPREKIGIVGRTGAGKSSLITTLFRLAEPSGTILIDDVDTKTLSLHDLRTVISIIPQDPVLFTGTLRMNLNPFSRYTDDELWNVLELAHLKPSIQKLPDGLSHQVLEGGINLSVGERQLLCLARAILLNNKVIVLDEATASVDKNTDKLIQDTIRTRFMDSTVLTIAHRLNTVMDCDRIMVLDAGVIKEFDHPYVLLQDTQGYFSRLIHSGGATTQLQLKQIAEKSYFKSRKQN